MLAVTPAASAAITKALRGVALPDGAGLRFFAGERSDRATAIEIRFVTDAAPGDHVLDVGTPATLFVEPTAARLLRDHVLDAHIDQDGCLAFTLQPRAANAPVPRPRSDAA